RSRPSLPSPTDLGTPGSCGDWARISLTPRRGGSRRRQFDARVVEAGRSHRERLTFRCVPADSSPPPPPPPATCPAGTTCTRPCEGVVLPPRTVGRSVDFPPSQPIASCGYGTSSNYVQPSAFLDPAAPAELHVIGVYEAAGSTGSGGPSGLQPAP